MLEGFDSPDFGATKDFDSKRLDPEQHFNTFKTLKSTLPKSFLAQNPSSSLARFTRNKYINLVHAKIECSFFRNLNQRKLVTSRFKIGATMIQSQVYLSPMITLPVSRCAMNLLLRTEELTLISTKSIAMVGTSAIMMHRGRWPLRHQCRRSVVVFELLDFDP
ncbi:hypothetical protein J1N35_010215 [Gossypium stocksii]|uniref:Uncharacterized protein n=1 Tax=Gossypium stocksii TaxID=47602 RepID=A0A9D3W0K7_9ROSI|nr:hypothetical protein J1N35_010215 [Gossypium stocksii]